MKIGKGWIAIGLAAIGAGLAFWAKRMDDKKNMESVNWTIQNIDHKRKEPDLDDISRDIERAMKEMGIETVVPLDTVKNLV